MSNVRFYPDEGIKEFRFEEDIEYLVVSEERINNLKSKNELTNDEKNKDNLFLLNHYLIIILCLHYYYPKAQQN